MADPTMHEGLAKLASQEATIAALQATVKAQGTRIARHERARRTPRRLFPALLVALLVALVPLSALAAHPFTDLNPGSVHNANIDAIYNAGVTTGCVPNAEYCPNANATREEMASFLARLGGLGTNPPVANAAMLGGQPAASYARRAEFRALQLIGQSGGLSIQSPVFTVGGGALVFLISGSAYRASPGKMTLDFGLTATAGSFTRGIGATSVYTNEPGSHKAFPSAFLVFTDVPAGSYTVSLSIAPPIIADANDFFAVTLLEFPKP